MAKSQSGEIPQDEIVDRLNGLIAKGLTDIIELLPRAEENGISQVQTMAALLALRRSGQVTFDGRYVEKPARTHTSHIKTKPVFDPTRSDDWFRLGYFAV